MTIPSSELVSVTPSVLSAGGAGISTIGLVLSSTTRVPIGTVASFPSALAVQNYFGPGTEASGAAIYFTGFEGAAQTPAAILFAQYPVTAVAAFLRGGNISAVSLATLQSYSGSLTVVVDGYTHVISSISLASYGSQSAMAAAIQAAFTEPTEATFTASMGASFTGSAGSPSTNLVVTGVTGYLSVGDTVSGSGITTGTTVTSFISGTLGGAGTYGLSAPNTASSSSLTSTSNVLDVTICASPTIAVGQTVVNVGLSGAVIITSQISGTAGGVGLYLCSGTQQSVAGGSFTSTATMPLVTYDSISGAFVITSGITGTPSTVAFATGTLAPLLLLQQAQGAVLSQGAAAAVPATFMNALIQVNDNWVAFHTAFNPDGNTGLNVVKQAFAAWNTTAEGGNNFVYVCADHDPTPAATVPATSSLGYILAQNGNSGTCLVYEPSAGGPYYTSWFVLGCIASIDFGEPNGRITFAFKAQAGLPAGVTDPTTANNLAGNPQSAGSDGNGYNFYGAYATAGMNNIWLQRGFVTGPYQWLDSYVNQIWLSNQLQIALLTAFANNNSIPFNSAGYALLEQALQPAIVAGETFGAFSPGTITAAQAQQINAVTGNNASNTLQTQGWYLQVVIASGVVKAARGPQQINFWYVDNGSIQVINLSSVAVT